MSKESSTPPSAIGICLTIAALLLSLALATWLCLQGRRSSLLPSKPRTVEQVLTALGPVVEGRIRPAFDRARVKWPPRPLTLLALKAERRLEVYAVADTGEPHLTLEYPILAASGTSGPKDREGDNQVPEGFYRVELLNPNSRYHLSLRVNYPNADDFARARENRRDISTLGGDIMIHGGARSAGCLAVGDPAVEELFVLVAASGLDNVELIVAPFDFRRETPANVLTGKPAAIVELYGRLTRALEKFPLLHPIVGDLHAERKGLDNPDGPYAE